MTRAERRRKERARKKAAKKGLPEQGLITLENPVARHFETFIVGNVAHYQEVYKEEPPVAVQDSAEGQTLLLCGAGPSLAEHIEEYRADQVWGCNSALTWLHDEGHDPTHGFCVDQTPHMLREWESAPDVEYLIASSVHCALVEFLISKNRHLRFFNNYVGIKKPPVEYCKCGHDRDEHKKAEERIRKANQEFQEDNRELRELAALSLSIPLPDLDWGDDPDWKDGCKHCECTKYAGRVMEYEDWLYTLLWPATCRAGSGLNSVTRAIDVALFMGFEKISILGADCSISFDQMPPTFKLPDGKDAEYPPGSPENTKWLENHTRMHVDGSSAIRSGATAVTMISEIDGRWWLTKPDLAISAMCLVQMTHKHEDRIELVGDTFPNAIKDKPKEYLARLPNFVDNQGNILDLV